MLGLAFVKTFQFIHTAYHSNESKKIALFCVALAVFFLSKSNPQHDLRNSVVKDVVASVHSGNCCCSITRIWSLHLEKALEDGKWLKDVSILARELSSVA